MIAFTGALPKDDAAMKRKLEQALCHAGNTHTLADIAALLAKGHAQWWCNGDGAVITEIFDHPQIRVVNYWLVAGKLGACLDLQAPIDAWAAGLGCVGATASGRRQWTPVLQRHGWEPHAVQFHKRFRPEVAP